jgi:rhodanese-related sulfurtransferase
MHLSLAKHSAAAILVVGVTSAALADTPESLAGAKLVAAEDVAKLQAAGTPVFDTRIASDFAEGHIKGAISVPYREKSEKSVAFDAGQDEFDLAKLPTDKGAPLIVYCNGPECWKSFKAATAAIKNGYSSIYWYRAGFPDWKSKGLPTE